MGEEATGKIVPDETVAVKYTNTEVPMQDDVGGERSCQAKIHREFKVPRTSDYSQQDLFLQCQAEAEWGEPV
eukprot:7398033-Lingulodinium_polyedra.AAC.1